MGLKEILANYLVPEEEHRIVSSGNEELLTSTGDIGKDEATEGAWRLFSGKALGVNEICPEYLKPVYVLGLSWLICRRGITLSITGVNTNTWQLSYE